LDSMGLLKKKPKLEESHPVGQTCFTCGLRGDKKNYCKKYKRKIEMFNWCKGWEKFRKYGTIYKQVKKEPEKKEEETAPRVKLKEKAEKKK